MSEGLNGSESSGFSTRQKVVLGTLVGAVGGAGLTLASRFLPLGGEEAEPTPIIGTSPDADAAVKAIVDELDREIEASRNTLATANAQLATAEAVLTGTPTMSPNQVATVEAIGAQIAATERARTIPAPLETPTPISTERPRPVGTATSEATATSSFDAERLCNELKDVVVTDVEGLPEADPCPDRKGSYVVSVGNQNRTFRDWLNDWGARAYMWLMGDRNPLTQDASIWIQTQESVSSGNSSGGDNNPVPTKVISPLPTSASPLPTPNQ